ncbi:hypothetical protein ACFVR1_04685 [Psychrobacillus sp. NPDC058041]|uniref:hypothetical protein n=1 Tax=Psychrobacillus sp. NPDC058041 TaxID=3346310 RepID=UPI0036DD1051
MVYKATSQRNILLILLTIAILMLIINIGEYHVQKYISILLSIFCFVGLFTTYEFEIKEDELNYKTLLFVFTVFQKKLYSADIYHVTFKRVGWATKGAIIRLHRGINIRIIQFNHKDVMSQLETFSLNNNVPVIKSKDYLVLEKLAK